MASVAATRANPEELALLDPPYAVAIGTGINLLSSASRPPFLLTTQGYDHKAPVHSPQRAFSLGLSASRPAVPFVCHCRLQFSLASHTHTGVSLL